MFGITINFLNEVLNFLMEQINGYKGYRLIGERLKQIRKNRGLTLQKVADAIGVSRSTISMYENGARSVTIKMLYKLADYFMVDINELIILSNEYFDEPNNLNNDIIITKIWERVDIVELEKKVKDRADGRCELCGHDAPFIDKNGEPYLEIHYLEPIKQGGERALDNIVALCPNCHSRLECLNLEGDKRYLMRKIINSKDIRVKC